MDKKVRILFCCMGNICRSPTAEGVFLKLLEEEGLAHAVDVDSAGTHSYHVGKPPDSRAQATARKRGIDLSELRARAVSGTDFHRFDYVLAMDRSNYEDLLTVCPPGSEEKLGLFLHFAPELGEEEVPDPYYGGPSGFERVMDMVEAASRGLLADIRRRHGL